MLSENLLFHEDVIPKDDFAFLYGFSIFETFLVDKNSNIFLLEKHIERLLNSISFFKIEYNLNKEDLIKLIFKYISENKLCNVILRVTVSAGNKTKGIPPNIYLTQRKNTYTKEQINTGCKLHISDIRKSETSILLKHKTSNYLENFWILQNAINDGYDDAILLNSLNFITETTKCNLFFVKDNILYTPDINAGLLPGILRSFIIDTAKKKNITLNEGTFTVDELVSADEIFVTNSVIGIMHVTSIENKMINNANQGIMCKMFKGEIGDWGQISKIADN